MPPRRCVALGDEGLASILLVTALHARQAAIPATVTVQTFANPPRHSQAVGQGARERDEANALTFFVQQPAEIEKVVWNDAACLFGNPREDVTYVQALREGVEQRAEDFAEGGRHVGNLTPGSIGAMCLCGTAGETT